MDKLHEYSNVIECATVENYGDEILSIAREVWAMWKDGMDEKIREILGVSVRKEDHHFGRPFLTAYQIAIEFKHRFPDTFDEFGLPLGGRDINERTSFTQQLARELSQRIESEKLVGVEGRDLFVRGIETLSFPCEGGTIDSSKDTHLSMYRLTDKDPR